MAILLKNISDACFLFSSEEIDPNGPLRLARESLARGGLWPDDLPRSLDLALPGNQAELDRRIQEKPWKNSERRELEAIIRVLDEASSNDLWRQFHCHADVVLPIEVRKLPRDIFNRYIPGSWAGLTSSYLLAHDNDPAERTILSVRRAAVKHLTSYLDPAGLVSHLASLVPVLGDHPAPPTAPRPRPAGPSPSASSKAQLGKKGPKRTTKPPEQIAADKASKEHLKKLEKKAKASKVVDEFVPCTVLVDDNPLWDVRVGNTTSSKLNFILSKVRCLLP